MADTSDIDAVVILDELRINDLKAYRDVLDALPNRELVCGFIVGKDELLHWEASDLFQFYYDIMPIEGTLDMLLEKADEEAVKRAIRIGACNIYHACVHNFLHEKSDDILPLCISLRFSYCKRFASVKRADGYNQASNCKTQSRRRPPFSRR